MALIMGFFMGLCLSSLALAEVPTSTISAAPALLPTITPTSSPSPALSPDITPLFPSPGGGGLSPTESSFPIIPSSPSPPNPDDMAAAGPNMAFSPYGSLPVSSSTSLSSVMVGLGLGLGLVTFWLLQLSSMQLFPSCQPACIST